MKELEVASLIVSKNGITLFLTNGESEVLSQDSWKTAAIVQEIMLPLAEVKGPVKIDVSQFSLASQITEMTGGAVKVEEDEKGAVSLTIGDTKVEDASGLVKHMEQASYGRDATGFKKFMESFAEIEHKHSAKELL